MPIVYKLINPINNKIYYVGYTERKLSERLFDHLQSDPQQTTKKLLKAKLQPIMEVIEEGENVTKHTETFWIKRLHSEGIELENISDIVNLEYLHRPSKAILSNSLTENERLRIALMEILDQLPLSSSVGIVIRIKHICETALSI